jgi:sugar (pentulose or hexulose) kinase
MLAAWHDVRANNDYISLELSPSTVWLTALHDYVASSAPADATSDGTVAHAGFWTHLDAFLKAEVQSRSPLQPHLVHNCAQCASTSCTCSVANFVIP